ncbi:MAG: kynureninase [Flavisolibacter sp.]
MNFENSIEFAQKSDQQDPLRKFREKFFIPQHNNKDAVYFTGNSLGLQPKSTIDYINQELEDWAALGVMGHSSARNTWLHYHEQFAAPLSRIVGAKETEVVAMNQLTVNIHLLLASFYRPTKERFRIICEAKAFPSDQYALNSQAQWHGFDASNAIVEVAPRPGEHTLRTEDILKTIEKWRDSVAVVFLGGVNYYTGQVLDMAAITKATHDAGALAGFDLAHAAGNIELKLHDWNVDFACWCSYKYLNSSPGGVSGVYIHEKHATNPDTPRLAGWWGTQKERRFLMEKNFVPTPTAEGWQLSNAPVLLMAAHKASLALFEEAGMPALLQKSRQLTGYLFFILSEINNRYEKKVIELITPRGAHGCQVSMLMLEKGKEIFDALISRGVICDWREPNVIRVAPVPLYNTFEDVWTFGDIIKTILDQ